MARRHSLQNRPSPSGPPSSFAEPVSDHKDETNQDPAIPGGRKRSSSVTGFFTKFLPSHRPERSGTLRDQGFWEQHQSEKAEPQQRPGRGHKHGSDSIVSSGWNPALPLPRRTQTTKDRSTQQQTPPATRRHSLTPRRLRLGDRGKQQGDVPTAVKKEIRTETEVVKSTVSKHTQPPQAPTENTIQRLVTTFDTKREARRLRRSLKESRDFLGVQGINPQTGMMDVLTPTSSSHTDHTMMSAPEPVGYAESLSDIRAAYQHTARTRDAEEASLERLRKEQDRLDKMQRKKDSIRAFQQRVRWRKDRNQWSSVAEPDLSPIADASTRSRTPRSTSDGAIIPPPAIQKVLRGEEQRTVSTPAGLKTAAGSPQDRPGITTHESSDTVIHTPHPGSDRRFSVAADLFGTGTSSPEAIRRASEPGPSVGLGSPALPTSDRGVSRKPVPPPKDKQKPPTLKLAIPGGLEGSTLPGTLDHRSSFLGMRIGESGEIHHHGQDQASMSPSTPMNIGQDENNRPGGLPNMDRTPIGSPPDVAVRDFARPRNRRVWFVDHPSTLGTPRRHSPTHDQIQGASAATATSPPSQQRTLHLQRAPLIPVRPGHSQKETRPAPKSNLKRSTINLIDVGIPSETQDSPTAGWAQQLMDDIASFGHDTSENEPPATGDVRENQPCAARDFRENSPPTVNTAISAPTDVVERAATESPPTEPIIAQPPVSAYIPITTITGYDPRLLVHTRGLNRKVRSDGSAEDTACKDDRVIRISATEAATKIQVERMRAHQNAGQHRDGRVTQVSTTELTDDTERANSRPGMDQQPQSATLTSAPQLVHPSFDLLASPPRLPPSVWPSLDIPVPVQQQHRMPAASAGHHVASELTTTEMVPYGANLGPASGTTSSPGNQVEASLSVPAKTALIHAAQDTPTTSESQLAPTRERCERLYRRASRLHSSQAPQLRQALMTPAIGPYLNNKDTTMVPYNCSPGTTATASLRYTSTYQATVPKYRFMPPLQPSRNSSDSSSNSGPSTPRWPPTPPKKQESPKRQEAPKKQELLKKQESSNNEPQPPREPATEAARTALMGTQYNAATGRIVHVGSRKRNKDRETTTSSTSTAGASDHQSGGRPEEKLDGGDIEGHFSGKIEGEGGARRVRLIDPHAGRFSQITRGDNHDNGVAGFLVKAAVVYWNLIAPVFDAGSAVSKRFSAGKSTWQDCGVYALALMFVLCAFLAVVWGVKGVLLVVGLGRAVAQGFGVLIGF